MMGQLRFKGAYVCKHEIKEGIGAPIVSVERGRNAPSQRDLIKPKIYYALTVLIRFEGRRAAITFEDPLETERVTLAGQTFPLAADFTVPTAVLIARQNLKDLELDSLLQPEKYAGTARVIRIQPYP